MASQNNPPSPPIFFWRLIVFSFKASCTTWNPQNHKGMAVVSTCSNSTDEMRLNLRPSEVHICWCSWSCYSPNQKMIRLVGLAALFVMITLSLKANYILPQILHSFTAKTIQPHRRKKTAFPCCLNTHLYLLLPGGEIMNWLGGKIQSLYGTQKVEMWTAIQTGWAYRCL